MPEIRYRTWITLAVLEGVFCIVAAVYGYGRLQDFIGNLLGLQIVIAVVMLSILYKRKREAEVEPRTTADKRWNALLGGVVALVTLGLTIGWIMGLYPYLVKSLLRDNGKPATAHIVSYELVNLGNRVQYREQNPATADAIVVELQYNGRITGLAIWRGQPAYQKVLAAAEAYKTVSVRYVPWLPAVVRTNYELYKQPDSSTAQ